MLFAALSEALSHSRHVGLEEHAAGVTKVFSFGARNKMITHAKDRRWRRTYLLFNVLAIGTIDREVPSDSTTGLRSRLAVAGNRTWGERLLRCLCEGAGSVWR